MGGVDMCWSDAGWSDMGAPRRGRSFRRRGSAGRGPQERCHRAGVAAGDPVRCAWWFWRHT